MILASFEAADLAEGTWEAFVTCWRSPPQNVQMLAEEEPNFHCAEVDVKSFARAMEPHIQSAWAARRRSLQAMSDTLNAREITTACGLQWTPRRLYLLLKLMHSRGGANDTYAPRQATSSMRTNKGRYTVPEPAPIKEPRSRKEPAEVVAGGSGRAVKRQGQAAPLLDFSKLAKLGRITPARSDPRARPKRTPG